MKRRDFLGAVSVGAAALGLSSSARGEAAPRPNILVILTDDHVYRAIGYNNPNVKTPNLDRLAGEGVIFDRTYVASPICVASRASLMTGVFPQQHGAVGLNTDGFRKSVVEDKRFRTLPMVLSESGYRTAFCGKSHLGPPTDYGFQEGEEHKSGDDSEAFAAASSFIQKRSPGDQPFFLWLGARQPHIPLRPEQVWLDLYRDASIDVDPNFRELPPDGSLYNQGLPGERYYRDSSGKNNTSGVSSGPPRSRDEMVRFMRDYYATISRLDHQVGELAATLKERALLEDTCIVFLGDNGYHLGNHGLGNKITMHEESVRVPMFIRWGGLPNKGARSRQLVSSLDVFPTLMDLVGAPHPETLEGRSLLPVFEQPDALLRKAVACECVGVGGEPGMGHRMIRSDRWKYILTDSNDEALFDEEADPYEMKNLANDPDQAKNLQEMRDRMRAWMRHIGDTHKPPPKAEG